MATQHNFRIKNGLEVAGTVRITSAGLITGTTTTQAASDNTTKLASTAYVTTALANLSDSAPSTLNTLNELAAALGDDANYATTTTNAIAAKLPLAGGTLTGTLIGTELNLNAAGDIHSTVNNSYMGLSGGTETNAGANIILYGQSHGSLANTSVFRSSGTERMRITSAGLVSMTHAAGAHTGGLSIINSQAGGYGSSLTFQSERSDDNSIVSAAQIRTQGQDSWNSAASADSNLFFATALNGSLTDKMVIKHDGQVMIGHTSSFAHADADNLAIGDGTNNSGLTIYTGSSKESSIIFGNAGTNGNIEAGIKYYHESHGTVANRRAMTFGTGGSMQERMRIDSSGRVGIGNNAPAQMLSVNSSSGSGVCPGRFTAGGNTNTLEVWGNSTASTSTGLLCNAGTNENDYSAKFRNYAGSTIMEVRGDSVIDIFGTTRLQDNNILAFGQSSDIRAYYDGTDSLYITATNGTANAIKTNANNTYIMQANGTQLITAIANSEVSINNDSSSSIDFRVESDNEQYNFFCDASSEIIHFGEGTNSDAQEVIPAGTLAGRRHGYHGGNKTHAGQTFKYCEGTSWEDAIKIDWNNASWGGVCMRITGMYDYNASNNFSIVIGFAGHAAYGSVSYDATSNGVLNWTNALQLAQTATGETMIRQRAGDNTGDVVYRYEWQTYNRSDQTILIVEQ